MEQFRLHSPIFETLIILKGSVFIQFPDMKHCKPKPLDGRTKIKKTMPKNNILNSSDKKLK